MRSLGCWLAAGICAFDKCVGCMGAAAWLEVGDMPRLPIGECAALELQARDPIADIRFCASWRTGSSTAPGQWLEGFSAHKIDQPRQAGMARALINFCVIVFQS